MILHHIAKNKEGVTVDIQDVSKQNRKEGYYCVVCGNEMIPALGEVREHHFRHKKDCNCNTETYLHKYAKYYIKKLFDNSKEFYISREVPERCCKYDNCEYRKDNYQCQTDYIDCKVHKKKRYDIKKYYDTCELESEYKGFIADIKLYSKQNPQIKPIFIEIAITHKCEEEKLKSGIRIIEIEIPKISDDLSEIDNELTETKRRNKNQININFYNFKFKEEPSSSPFNIHDFTSYYINSNNKIQSENHEFPCSGYGSIKYSRSTVEIHYCNKYGRETISALINLKKRELKNCYVCKHFWKTYDLNKRCNVGNNITSPSQAVECPSYEYSITKAKRLGFGFRLKESAIEGLYTVKRETRYIKKDKQEYITIEAFGGLSIWKDAQQVYTEIGKVYGKKSIPINSFEAGEYSVNVGGEYNQKLIIE